jgi:hypothetical protein
VLVVPVAIAPRLPSSFEVAGCVGFVVSATARKAAAG